MDWNNWLLEELTPIDETNSFFNWWIKLNNFYTNTLHTDEATGGVLSAITAILIVAIPIIGIPKLFKFLKDM